MAFDFHAKPGEGGLPERCQLLRFHSRARMEPHNVQRVRRHHAGCVDHEPGRSATHVGQERMGKVDVRHDIPGLSGTALVGVRNAQRLAVLQIRSSTFRYVQVGFERQQVPGVAVCQGLLPIGIRKVQTAQSLAPAEGVAQVTLRNLPLPDSCGVQVKEIVGAGDVADTHVGQGAKPARLGPLLQLTVKLAGLAWDEVFDEPFVPLGQGLGIKAPRMR
jgi:hypothetical protein